MELISICPLYPPARGGGSEYAEFLTQHMTKQAHVQHVRIITERWPGSARTITADIGCGGHCATIERRLPRFFSAPRRTVWRYARYTIQSIQLASLVIGLCRTRKSRRVLLIHGAFFIHPTPLLLAVALARRFRGKNVRIVVDVRDPSAPRHRLAKLALVDGFISCGRRVTSLLESSLDERTPIREIPVPMTYFRVSESDTDDACARHGIKKGSYILWPHGIRDTKGFPGIHRSWAILVERGYGLDLVVVGDAPDWHPEYGSQEDRSPRVIFLGPLANHDVRRLMAGAALVANASTVESLGRVCLEALSVGAPTLLPSGVPEFGHLGRRNIAVNGSSVDLANQMIELLDNGQSIAYPLDRHSVKSVAKAYSDFITELYNSGET